MGSDSALARDLDKRTGWEDTIQTNILLADIYDLLQVINANICGGKKRNFKPYPRPGRRDDNKKIGKGAMPLTELLNWIKERQHG